MRTFLIFILTLYFGVSYSQGFEYPVLKSKGQTLKDFVPAGWTILDSTYGDLNKDYLDDYVIILQHKDSVPLTNDLKDRALAQPRILLILFKSPDENYLELIEQSNSFILKHDNPAMDDPYEKIAIKKGVLEIAFNLFYNIGSWDVTNTVYKFRYQQMQFVLIGADNFIFDRATHDFKDYSYNFITQRRTLTKGNDDKGKKKTTWKTINIRVLKTLKTFTEPFIWEVEKGIYL